jgi:hypothetical protein
MYPSNDDAVHSHNDGDERLSDRPFYTTHAKLTVHTLTIRHRECSLIVCVTFSHRVVMNNGCTTAPLDQSRECTARPRGL